MLSLILLFLSNSLALLTQFGASSTLDQHDPQHGWKDSTRPSSLFERLNDARETRDVITVLTVRRRHGVWQWGRKIVVDNVADFFTGSSSLHYPVMSIERRLGADESSQKPNA